MLTGPAVAGERRAQAADSRPDCGGRDQDQGREIRGESYTSCLDPR